MPWKKLLANVTGSIDEELKLRNEYLVAENRILRSKINGRLRLKDEERLDDCHNSFESLSSELLPDFSKLSPRPHAARSIHISLMQRPSPSSGPLTYDYPT